VKFIAHRISKREDGEYILTNGDIPVRKVLAYLDQGKTHAQIKAKLPAIKEKDIEVCQLLATFAMQDRPEYRKNKRLGGRRIDKEMEGVHYVPVKFLFDENLPWDILFKVLNNIAEVSHVHTEDLGGAPDLEIWDKFRTNGSRAIIVTQDDDFIKLSKIFAMEAMLDNRSLDNDHVQEAVKDMPFVVHIPSKSIRKKNQDSKKTKKKSTKLRMTPQKLAEQFRKQSSKFVKEASRNPQRTTYMSMTSAGLKRGPSLPEIFAEFVKPPDGHKKGGRGRPKKIDPDSFDIETLSFHDRVDWKKLNRMRKEMELPSVKASDYEDNYNIPPPPVIPEAA